MKEWRYILNFGTRRRCSVSLTSRPLYPRGKNPPYPLRKMLGRYQSRSRLGGEWIRKITCSYAPRGKIKQNTGTLTSRWKLNLKTCFKSQNPCGKSFLQIMATRLALPALDDWGLNPGREVHISLPVWGLICPGTEDGA
jgi:hypothetical protein